MVGPPTPPPTTAAELRDEARTAASTTHPATTAPSTASQPRPDHFQYRFPAIVEATSKKEYQRLIQIAEETDLNANGDRQPTRLLIIAPLVLAYLILDDLAPARYGLARLPENLAALPLTKSLVGLAVSSVNRQHGKVYAQAEHIFSLVAQPDFIDRELASVLANLITVFVAEFRHRTLLLLSKAYTSLPLSLAQTYIGMTAKETVTETDKFGWVYDPSTQMLHPFSKAELSNKSTITTPPSSLSTFHLVADSVGKLEF
ncbi:hypothetical protein K443DRAFT_672732 [Laccaria amethystina LaAM-08-1]|jgi:COP9 signalosome complex subunit 8|uniref:CSN8/PSMD8/EIF3K domain-containing protein n=1 Tax=Laccaria amethystina LaAM-08-1 TaxID=1095629 RepID=A0A0C9YCX8_9AGAR|nr:hypothetical protein K443DRAFT_672732 [Laccaria amethystina LaAM-08-1]